MSFVNGYVKNFVKYAQIKLIFLYNVGKSYIVKRY